LRAENARLKAELKRVVEEREILNKTAEYFAKAFGFGRNERFAWLPRRGNFLLH